MTYSGQGTLKWGVHAKDHAVIYTDKPVIFDGEEEKGLTMKSIKVSADSPRHKLTNASRLNYAKPYTVEYNVKVWFVGKVDKESEWQFVTNYNRVHAPIETKGLTLPPNPDETYMCAQGGESSSYQAPYSQISNTALPLSQLPYSGAPYVGQSTSSQAGDAYSGVATTQYSVAQVPSYPVASSSNSTTGYPPQPYSYHESQTGESLSQPSQPPYERQHGLYDVAEEEEQRVDRGKRRNKK